VGCQRRVGDGPAALNALVRARGCEAHGDGEPNAPLVPRRHDSAKVLLMTGLSAVVQDCVGELATVARADQVRPHADPEVEGLRTSLPATRRSAAREACRLRWPASLARTAAGGWAA